METLAKKLVAARRACADTARGGHTVLFARNYLT
jgi:hypothetical protein